jgi:hypothetical protein
MRIETACLSKSPTTQARADLFSPSRSARASVGCLVLILLGLASTESLQGQYISRSQEAGIGTIAPISRSQAVGIIAGIAVAGVGIGIGVTYLILHNRGIATGCVTESGGRRVLTTGSKAYSLIETGPALATGERYKLKGRTSGPSSARIFTVDKTLTDLGSCP